MGTSVEQQHVVTTKARVYACDSNYSFSLFLAGLCSPKTRPWNTQPESINPFRTALSFRGCTTWNLCALSSNGGTVALKRMKAKEQLYILMVLLRVLYDPRLRRAVHTWTCSRVTTHVDEEYTLYRYTSSVETTFETCTCYSVLQEMHCKHRRCTIIRYRYVLSSLYILI